MMMINGLVDLIVKNEIFIKDEIIEDVISIDYLMLLFIRMIKVYYRSKEDCLFNRGNWIIDFFNMKDYFFDLCIKLLVEMSYEDILRYLKLFKDKCGKKMLIL